MSTRGRSAAPRPRRTTLAASLACACAMLHGAPRAHAATPPAVPANIQVPADARLVRVEHAVGTQNYVCVPNAAGTGVEWVQFGPQATLFTAHGRQTMTHFLSANPDEAGTPRPAWLDSRDSSAVWANPVASSSDPAYVEPTAIPWLLLHVVGSEAGPRHGRSLTRTAYLQRIHTTGGKAPATGCADEGDLRKKALVPYTADYLFYRSTARD